MLDQPIAGTLSALIPKHYAVRFRYSLEQAPDHEDIRAAHPRRLRRVDRAQNEKTCRISPAGPRDG
jgi:hypothetical protein